MAMIKSDFPVFNPWGYFMFIKSIEYWLFGFSTVFRPELSFLLHAIFYI